MISRCWILHFADAEPLPVIFLPPVTHEAALEAYPRAVAAVPYEPKAEPFNRPDQGKEEQEIRAWLESIGEPDVEAAMDYCRQHERTFGYFLKRARGEL
jgi:hypothetical protein